MWSRRFVEQLSLAGAVALSRFIFRSHALYDVDSVNFALALERFDPRTYQPHPPGYFLYIALGRLIHAVVHDANLALVLLSIAASCGTVVMIYRMALQWFGKEEARFAGLLFLFSPLAWFHGTVALTYAVEAFFSVLVAYLCWQVEEGDSRLITPAAIVLAVSAGVRPSSMLLLGPLFLFSLRRAPLQRAAIGLGVLLLAVAAWFLPMIRASGGFHVYFDALRSLWRLVPGRDTVFNSSPATSIARAFTVALIFLITFGTASLAAARLAWRSPQVDPAKKTFTLVWILPALCFYIFIFLKFVNSGYLLLLLAPGCLWIGRELADWFRASSLSDPVKFGVVGLAAVANTVIFVASPLYCSYRSVHHFEAELDDVQKAIPVVSTPGNTVLVGFDSHFLGYRHAGYYLPNYLTLQYPEVKLLEGPRIFTMEGRDTRLTDGLPNSPFTQFLLFPLPAQAAANSVYLQKVEKLLPPNTLRTVHIGNHDFISGPLSALPLLFPEAKDAGSGVYPPLHSEAMDVNRREHSAISAP